MLRSPRPLLGRRLQRREPDRHMRQAPLPNASNLRATREFDMKPHLPRWGAKMRQRRPFVAISALTLLPALFVMLGCAASIAQPARNLQGTWKFSRVNSPGPGNPGGSGTVVVNSSGRASSSTLTPDRTIARQSGHVTVSGNKIEVIFTAVNNRSQLLHFYATDHFYCTLESARTMSCHNNDQMGVSSNAFTMSRG